MDDTKPRASTVCGSHGCSHFSDRNIMGVMTDHVTKLYRGNGLVNEEDVIFDKDDDFSPAHGL